MDPFAGKDNTIPKESRETNLEFRKSGERAYQPQEEPEPEKSKAGATKEHETLVPEEEEFERNVLNKENQRG